MKAALARRPRRRLIAGGAVGASALVIGVIVLTATTGGGGGAPAAASNSTATTEIRRQDLVEVDSQDGTLGYSDGREVVNRLSGTLTWLPAAGAVIEPGGILYRVDSKPVILMDGRVPAYRRLASGVSGGADVEQLERNLRTLGHDPGAAMAIDSDWTAATTSAVKRWQEANDLAATGAVDLGRIVFQPGPRRVSKLEATLGSDGASGSGASGGRASAQTQFASYTPATTTPQTTTPETTDPDEEAAEKEAAAKKRAAEEKEAAEEKAAAQKKSAGPQVPQSGGSGASGGSGGSSAPGSGTGSGSSGDSGESPSAPVMKTTSTRQLVTVKLPADKQSLARPGAAVAVSLPSGDAVDGKIATVGKVATAPPASQGEEGGDESATIRVTVRLAKRSGALDQAPVTVDFQQSKQRGVLAVPVTALLARAGGKFAVEVRGAGGERRLVPVRPGLYAGGYVEIAGRGLRSGMKVTDARV